MRMSKFTERSYKAHLNSYKRINNKMLSKNGFYKKGEFKSLEHKRIYHLRCADLIYRLNHRISTSTKKEIFKNIYVDDVK